MLHTSESTASLNGLDTNFRLFDVTVKSVLGYGAEVWAPELLCNDALSNYCERVHLFDLKWLWGVRKSTASCIVLAETGRRPLAVCWNDLSSHFEQLLGAEAPDLPVLPVVPGTVPPAESIEGLLQTHFSMEKLTVALKKQGATGQTPFFLNHGLHPHTPASLLADSLLPASLSPHADDYLKKLKTAWKCAHQCVLAAQETMKKRADRHRRPSPFKVGDKVLVFYKVLKMPDVTARKLQHRYFGPYPVKQLCGENAVVVELSAGRTRSFNVSKLKPWKEDPDTFPHRDYSQPGPVEVIGDEEYFTIDRFIKNRWVRSGRGYKEQFLVHWKNYPPEDVSWLPVQQLESEMEKDSFTKLLKTLQTRKPRPAPKPKRKMNNNSQQQQAAPRAQRPQQQQEPTRVRTRAQR
ncbi:hypothetical protein KSW81_000328 [Nannochloris sp. 'desiccata']|nr:hypothetical protein KSW81_000328 [Chlorella desiccata (nom. nud.)]